MDTTPIAMGMTSAESSGASTENAQPRTATMASLESKKRLLGAESDAQTVDMEGETVSCCACQAPEVKYRCPRCERITCSLACCLTHKKEFDCNGKRDRTKYIPTKQFTDSDLSSDFFFLEEVTRSTSTAARSRSQLGVNVKRYGANKPQPKKRRVGENNNNSNTNNNALAHGGVVNPHVPADWLTRFPVAFQLLVTHAAKRGVALTLLAPGMSKRVRNTSYMNTKTAKLFWRVEWSFPGADVAVALYEERADDALTPLELLDKYLERRPDNTGLRSKLKQYATSTWRQDLVLLLRKEFSATSQPQYYRLDGHLSLESNLKRKAVVEFPVIMVVLRDELNQYAVVNDLIEIVDVSTQAPVVVQPGIEELSDPVALEEPQGMEDTQADGDDGEEIEEELAGQEEELPAHLLDGIIEEEDVGALDVGLGSSQDDALVFDHAMLDEDSV